MPDDRSFEEEFEISFRLAAVEAILNDMIAKACLATPEPQERARAERERWKMITSMSPHEEIPSAPGFAEIVSGGVADSIDKLMQAVEGTVRKRLASRGHER